MSIPYRSAFEVDTRDSKRPVVKLEVVINGAETYKYDNIKINIIAFF